MNPLVLALTSARPQCHPRKQRRTSLAFIPQYLLELLGGTAIRIGSWANVDGISLQTISGSSCTAHFQIRVTHLSTTRTDCAQIFSTVLSKMILLTTMCTIVARCGIQLERPMISKWATWKAAEREHYRVIECATNY